MFSNVSSGSLLLRLALVTGTSMTAFVGSAVAQGVTTTQLTDSLYMMQGRGGNVLLSFGDDGAVMIDDDYPNMVTAYQSAVDEVMGEDFSAPQYVINTHWHQDHTGGNSYWAGEGAKVIAHNNVRKRMQEGLDNKALGVVFPPSPEEALPVMTFDSQFSLYVNSEAIVVEHFSAGHTDGDSMVFFTNDNVVHMGDHFFNGRFPFVDIESGGNVLSYTQNVASVLARIDDATQVVPGHGPLASKAELEAYHAMLVETVAEVRAAFDAGKSVDDIVAAGLDAKWAEWGTGFINEATWIRTIVGSL
jgi:glyoxylase-like metal-dependent hydrolase (beta-lactamase superfamily II)